MTSVSSLILNLSYINRIEIDIKLLNVDIATYLTRHYLNIFHMDDANVGEMFYLAILIRWMIVVYIPLLSTYT